MIIHVFLLLLAGCPVRPAVTYPHEVTSALQQYLEGEDFEETTAALNQALKNHPKNLLLWYAYGDVKYVIGDFTAAADAFAEATRLASEEKSSLGDIVGQVSLATMEAMAKYVPEYEQKLEETIDAALDNFYRDSDGAYFTTLVAKVKQLRRKGRFDESLALGETGGCLQKWHKIGPFGNTDLMGFDKTFAPEVEIPWRETYELRNGTPSAGVAEAATEACWTSLGFEGEFRGGTFYAMTLLQVSAETDLVFRLSSFSATSLMIDGIEVIRADRRKALLPNSMLARVSLEPGNHHVVVKISSSSSYPSFSLLWKPSAASGPEAGGNAGVRPLFPEAKYLPLAPPPTHSAELKESLPDSDMRGLLMADLYIIRGIPTLAREELAPLKDKYHRSFSVVSRSLITEGLDSSVPFSIRINKSKAQSTLMNKHHPQSWLPYIYLAQLEKQAGRLPEAADIINEGMENCPSYPGFIVELADLYVELGWEGDCVQALKQASDMLQGTCFLHTIDFLLASKFNDITKMEEHAKLAMECDSIDRTYVNILADREKWQEALKEQMRLLEGYRDDKWLLLDAGWSRFKSGDLAAYKKTLQESYEMNPRSFQEGHKLADIMASEGKEDEAAMALFGATMRTVNPPAFLHQKIAALKGWQYLFPYRRSFEESVAAFNASKGTEYKDTPAIEVLDHVTHRIFEDGSSATRYHSVKKLLTREGVEENGEFRVPEGAVVLKLHTVKPDGKKLQPEKIMGKPTVSYPTLEPGDYTETEWVQYLPPSAIFPGGTYLDRWYFQVPDLVLHRSEMVLITPADMKVSLNPRGELPEHEIIEEEGLKIYRWEALEMPHIRYEPDSPNMNEFLPSIQLNASAGWEDYFEWVRDILVDSLIVTPEMKAMIEEITDGIPKEKQRERIEALYRWVCDEIDPEEGITTPVSFIFHNRRGDRTKLLFAMLLEAGVPAELHLAETIYADKTPTDTPDFNRYSHFVVHAAGDWLLPYLKKAYVGFLPYQLRGQGTIRLFPEAGKSRIPELEPDRDWMKQKLLIEVDAAGHSTWTLHLRFKGAKAASTRDVIRNIPKGEIKQQLESSYLAQNFTGATLVSLSLPDIEDRSDELNIELGFTVPKTSGPFPGSVVIGPLLKSKIASQWTTMPSRSFPLLIDENVNVTTHVDINGKGQWQVMAPPKLLTSEKVGSAISFEQKTVISTDGGKLAIDREIKVPVGRISPSQYKDFLPFAGKVDEAEGGVYLLLPR
ncbi:MAG: hypothetical protein ABIJ56_11720 [Pseudomonadota bacterium]